jgi:hypothetical protein
MSSDLQRMLDHKRSQNKPIDLPMSILNTLISTQRGWIIRQAMKYAAEGGAALTAYLATNNINTNGEAVVAFCVTLAVGITERILSKMSAPIATPSK